MKKKASLFILIMLIILGYSFYNGYVWFNNPDSKKYQVRGIDVSNHQGIINWKLVKEQGYTFAYIKATEGNDYKDKYFNDNWKNTKALDISRGAYHFFTFGSSGVEQAKNFISTVPIEKHMLPIVIDIEFGGNSKNIPTKDKLKKELTDFIYEIETKYKSKPILYLTYDSYDEYIKGDFEEYQVWIRDIFKFPKFQNTQEWIFWQYCNRGRVKGVKGLVDLNVFNGNSSEFNKMISK
ncbi:MAG: glycoside hydrolase family 25 protein [Clostridiaceae bacterium]|nr:glycoside hydrolase family 25 protein [Clostridiaceae bacterium]